MARSGGARRLGHVRVVGGREEEVHRVLGAVEEGPAVRLGREALVLIGRLAARVGLSLALWVPGEHHVPRLGERLRRVPVHLLVGLDRAVGDHDAGALRRPGPRRPDVARQRGPVARREQHGLHDPVSPRLPVVEPYVPRAAVVLVPAQIADELPLRVRRLDGERVHAVLVADEAQLRLVLGRVVDPLALLDLREVLGLDDRVERGDGRSRARGRHDDGSHRAERHSHSPSSQSRHARSQRARARKLAARPRRRPES